LNRAVWSPLALAQVLLKMLVRSFICADTPWIFGIDPTIERRWGGKIAARGSSRDAVRSSDRPLVKTSGLGWISRMRLTTLPWAQRGWALPILTVRSPSERDFQQRGRPPQTLLHRSVQLLQLLRRWLPAPEGVVVGDNPSAALEFLAQAQPIGVTFSARLRLAAALDEPAPAYSGTGRPRQQGARWSPPQQDWPSADTVWRPVEGRWYDGQQRPLHLASDPAVWFHTGKPPGPLRWVLVQVPGDE
jgi:hypothetical protein